MNIKINNVQNLDNLNEAKKIDKVPVYADKELEILMKNKSKQFKFDCGVVMGKIDYPVNNKFGLNWHYVNTKSLEEFKTSINNFLSVTNNFITINDGSNLDKQYEKFKKKNEKI